MAKTPKFPVVIRDQSVAVKIYRVKARTTLDGWAYVVAWINAEGRPTKSFSDFAKAQEFATSTAAQLAAGVASGQLASRADFVELAELRRLAAEGGLTPFAAMSEWLRGRQLVGTAIIEACAAHAARPVEGIARIKVRDAVTALIEAKDGAGKSGKRVYGSKLKYVADALGDQYFDTIDVSGWSKFLARFDDPVTRNDIRKRVVTLSRWAQRHGHLAEDARLAIEKTERAKEPHNPIGILSPHQFRDLLEFFRSKHPRHLAAVVVAGFCGVRTEEIHGKKSNPQRRQRWEDVHIDRTFLSVTAAKENTPSSRVIHLCDAAVAWLRICPDQEGPICQINAIDRIRDIAKTNQMAIPPNAFRHSWITYRIALTGDKQATATEAGNSIKEIDRRYRVPKPKAEGESWFSIFPTA